MAFYLARLLGITNVPVVTLSKVGICLLSIIIDIRRRKTRIWHWLIDEHLLMEERF